MVALRLAVLLLCAVAAASALQYNSDASMSTSTHSDSDIWTDSDVSGDERDILHMYRAAVNFVQSGNVEAYAAMFTTNARVFLNGIDYGDNPSLVATWALYNVANWKIKETPYVEVVHNQVFAAHYWEARHKVSGHHENFFNSVRYVVSRGKFARVDLNIDFKNDDNKKVFFWTGLFDIRRRN